MESFGEYIKRQREYRAFTREEVSGATKVSLRYLEALESDNKDYLPSKPFVVGFLRVYSRYLGLDDDDTVTRYMDCLSEEAYEEPKELKELRKKIKRKNFIKYSALALLIVVSMFLVSLI